MKEQSKEAIAFNRSKIYERLSIQPEPPEYDKPISWIVQNQIAATNGVHYIDRIGKLNSYPIYELPVPKVSGNKLMLDIGSGWGRWLIAGGLKGYIPVGLDIRLEFCETQQTVTKENQIKAYSVVGDLDSLPFRDCIFDLIWSFSVIQHTHRDRFLHCLQGIDRTLKQSGFTKLEFPNKNGIRNRNQASFIHNQAQADYDNWSVRYYTLEEYRSILESFLDKITISNHSFLGIGVLKEDLKYVSFKNKMLCAISLCLSTLTKVFPDLTKISDSIYITAKKQSQNNSNLNWEYFLKQHLDGSFDNLNVVKLLRCPIFGEPVVLSADRKKVIVEKAGIFYPVYNDIPIMIASESLTM